MNCPLCDKLTWRYKNEEYNFVPDETKFINECHTCDFRVGYDYSSFITCLRFAIYLGEHYYLFIFNGKKSTLNHASFDREIYFNNLNFSKNKRCEVADIVKKLENMIKNLALIS